jgi:DNA invertase Pin-like site-specific DNA recombinase
VAPLAKRRGPYRTKFLVASESGRKSVEKRKQVAALFDDAAKRKFDCVLFWALDRFSYREPMASAVAAR